MSAATERQEAKRIQKEQEAEQIAKLIGEIKPVIQKMPTTWRDWDLTKTQQFKEFHATATKKINGYRIKVDDIIQIRRQVSNWYGV